MACLSQCASQMVQDQVLQQQQINHMVQPQLQSNVTFVQQINSSTQLNPVNTGSSLTPLYQETLSLPELQSEALSLTASRSSDTCVQGNYDQVVSKLTDVDTVKICSDTSLEAGTSLVLKNSTQPANPSSGDIGSVNMYNASSTANIGGNIFTEHKVVKVETEDGLTESNGPKSVFVCGVCDKMFSRRSGRDRHYRKHGQIAPSCDSAERKAANPYRPKCEDCGKDFARLDHLRRHVIIHTGLRPHVCAVCGQSFTRKDKMTAHLRRHSSELIRLSQITS